MKSLGIKEIKEILRIEIRKQILHAQHIDLGTNKWSHSGVGKSLDSIESNEYNLREILKDDLKSYLKKVDSKIVSILASMDIQVETESVAYKRLREHFVDLYLLRYEWIRELVSKTGGSDDDLRRDVDLKFGLELFPELSDSIELTELLLKDQDKIGTPKVKDEQASVNLPFLPIAGGTLSSNAKRYFERKRMEG